MKAKHKRIIGWSLAVVLFSAMSIMIAEDVGYKAMILFWLGSWGFIGLSVLCVFLILAKDKK